MPNLKKWGLVLLAVVLLVGLGFLIVTDVRDGDVVGIVLHVASFVVLALYAAELWKRVRDQ